MSTIVTGKSRSVKRFGKDAGTWTSEKQPLEITAGAGYRSLERGEVVFLSVGFRDLTILGEFKTEAVRAFALALIKACDSSESPKSPMIF